MPSHVKPRRPRSVANGQAIAGSSVIDIPTTPEAVAAASARYEAAHATSHPMPPATTGTIDSGTTGLESLIRSIASDLTALRADMSTVQGTVAHLQHAKQPVTQAPAVTQRSALDAAEAAVDAAGIILDAAEAGDSRKAVAVAQAAYDAAMAAYVAAGGETDDTPAPQADGIRPIDPTTLQPLPTTAADTVAAKLPGGSDEWTPADIGKYPTTYKDKYVQELHNGKMRDKYTGGYDAAGKPVGTRIPKPIDVGPRSRKRFMAVAGAVQTQLIVRQVTIDIRTGEPRYTDTAAATLEAKAFSGGNHGFFAAANPFAVTYPNGVSYTLKGCGSWMLTKEQLPTQSR